MFRLTFLMLTIIGIYDVSAAPLPNILQCVPNMKLVQINLSSNLLLNGDSQNASLSLKGCNCTCYLHWNIFSTYESLCLQYDEDYRIMCCIESGYIHVCCDLVQIRETMNNCCGCLLCTKHLNSSVYQYKVKMNSSLITMNRTIITTLLASKPVKASDHNVTYYETMNNTFSDGTDDVITLPLVMGSSLTNEVSPDFLICIENEPNRTCYKSYKTDIRPTSSCTKQCHISYSIPNDCAELNYNEGSYSHCFIIFLHCSVNETEVLLTHIIWDMHNKTCVNFNACHGVVILCCQEYPVESSMESLFGLKFCLSNGSGYNVDTVGILCGFNVHRENKLPDLDISRCCVNWTEYSTIDIENEISFDSNLTLVGIVTMSISSASIVIIFIFHIIFKQFRNLHGKCIVSLSVPLLVSEMSFLISIALPTSDDLFCKALAVCKHISLLHVFTWNCVMAYDIARKFSACSSLFTKMDDGVNNQRFVKYCLFGWGFPLLFVCSMIAVDGAYHGEFLLYGRKGICWINGYVGNIVTFFVPMTTQLGFCFLCFFVCLHGIEHQTKDNSLFVNSQKERNRCFIYLKISICLGLSWIFNYIPNFPNTLVMSYIAMIVYGLQGFFLLVSVSNGRILQNIKEVVRKWKK